MPMQRKTITITEQMEEWIKSRIDSGRYGNDSEYFRDLVRRDQDRSETESKLRSMLDEAEASGISQYTPEVLWAEAEQRHLAKNA